MKKTFQILSLCLAIMLCMSLGAFAGTQMENIWVEFNSVNLTVDGVPVSAPNILYDGTTYVPLRRTAEILGKEVGWDGATNTASISGGTSSGGAYTAKDMDNIKAATTALHNCKLYYSFGHELYNLYGYVVDDYNNYKNGNASNRNELKSKNIERFNKCIDDYNEHIKYEKTILDIGKDIGIDLSNVSLSLDNYDKAIENIRKAYESINSYEISGNKDDLVLTSNIINTAFDYLTKGANESDIAYTKCYDYIRNY